MKFEMIIYNYFKFDTNLNLYWFRKNRNLIFKKEMFEQRGDDAYFKIEEAGFSGIMGAHLSNNTKFKLDVILDNINTFTKEDNIVTFFIENEPEVGITDYEKSEFINKKNELRIRTGMSAVGKWNLYWYCLHWLSLIYPYEPTEEDKNQLIELKEKMINGGGITCGKCRHHFTEWNKKNPIENHLECRKNLVMWFIDLHNDVNERNKKSVLSLEEVIHIYEYLDYDELKNKYKLDVDSRFEKGEVSKIPDDVNNIAFKILREEYDVENFINQ